MNIHTKRRIPAALRARVWNTYIGEERGTFQCMCGAYVSQLNFECGHVVPVSSGGETRLENLRPLCTRCNRSMGSENLFEYMSRIGARPDLYWNTSPPPRVIDLVPRQRVPPKPIWTRWTALSSVGSGVLWTLNTSWWLASSLARYVSRRK